MLKAYFWFIAGLTSLGILGGLFFSAIPVSILIMFVATIYFLPVFSYAFKEKLFSQLVWKVYFLISILFNLTYFLALKIASNAPHYVIDSAGKTIDTSNSEFAFIHFAIILNIFLIPSYYSLYKLAFKK